jgi:hypothetical protein
LVIVVSSAAALRADVKTEQKNQFQFGGMLGKVVNFFGGKGAREGITSTVSVKGDRKMTVTGDNAQLIDLHEEKIYQIDLKGKSYKVITFDELRRQMQEAQKRAAEQARKPEEKAEPRDPNAKEYEVDFDMKETGQKKTINGFDTHEVVATITVREKGKTLEQSGGLVTTSDMWMAPRMASMKEIVDFDLRYFEKLNGPMIEGGAEQLATALAMYPGLKTALERLQKEGAKAEGTPILVTVTVDAVKSPEQMQQEEKSGQSDAPKSVGGMFGGLGKKIGGKKEDDTKAADASKPQAKNRVMVMTTNHEVLKIATDVAQEDISIPAGFKQK